MCDGSIWTVFVAVVIVWLWLQVVAVSWVVLAAPAGVWVWLEWRGLVWLGLAWPWLGRAWLAWVWLAWLWLCVEMGAFGLRALRDLILFTFFDRGGRGGGERVSTRCGAVA